MALAGCWLELGEPARARSVLATAGGEGAEEKPLLLAEAALIEGRDGTFREIGEHAGIAKGGEDEGKGLGVVVFDYDRDGWLDVYVANDGTPNYLFRNRGNLTFTEEAQAAGVALSAEGRALGGNGR